MVVIYTSVNSGGYDVQIWLDNKQLSSDRFQSRKAGHDWADCWLDASEYASLERDHRL